MPCGCTVQAAKFVRNHHASLNGYPQESNRPFSPGTRRSMFALPQSSSLRSSIVSRERTYGGLAIQQTQGLPYMRRATTYDSWATQYGADSDVAAAAPATLHSRPMASAASQSSHPLRQRSTRRRRVKFIEPVEETDVPKSACDYKGQGLEASLSVAFRA